MAATDRGIRSSEDGFTLIEVMVVVLIIGILLAIGVPTFLGARNAADDRATQSGLTVAFKSASLLMLESGNTQGANDEDLAEVEPSFVFQRQGHPSRIPFTISIRSQFNGWSAASLSPSDTCFFIRVNDDGTVEKGTIVDDYCTGSAAFNATAEGW